MDAKLTQAINAASSKKDLAAILEMLYEEAKNAYIDDLQKEDCIEVTIRIEVAKEQTFHIPTRRDLLDAIGALYERYEEGDWHARVFEIHTRAFCDAILDLARDRLYEIDSVKLRGDAERGFRYVQVKCSASPD